jgi:hypothetical protein
MRFSILPITFLTIERGILGSPLLKAVSNQQTNPSIQIHPCIMSSTSILTLNVPGDTDILMSPGAYRQHCRSSRRPVRFSGYIQGSVLAPPRHACSRRRRRRRSDHVGQAPEMFGIRLDHAASSVCCRKEDLPEPSPRPTGEGCALLPSGERQ